VCRSRTNFSVRETVRARLILWEGSWAGGVLIKKGSGIVVVGHRLTIRKYHALVRYVPWLVRGGTPPPVDFSWLTEGILKIGTPPATCHLNDTSAGNTLKVAAFRLTRSSTGRSGLSQSQSRCAGTLLAVQAQVMSAARMALWEGWRSQAGKSITQLNDQARGKDILQLRHKAYLCRRRIFLST